MSDASLSAAVSGGRLVALRALRDRLASEIDGCGSSRDVAALSARLMDVLEDIARVESAAPEQEGTALDELRRRREARVRTAEGSSGTVG